MAVIHTRILLKPRIGSAVLHRRILFMMKRNTPENGSGKQMIPPIMESLRTRTGVPAIRAHVPLATLPYSCTIAERPLRRGS